MSNSLTNAPGISSPASAFVDSPLVLSSMPLEPVDLSLLRRDAMGQIRDTVTLVLQTLFYGALFANKDSS